MADEDLTTVQAVRAHLGPLSMTDESLLQRLVTSASGFLTAMLSRPIKQASYTHDCDGNGGTKLYLPVQPATAVSAVTIDGLPVDPSTSVTGIGYVLAAPLLVLRGRVFTKGSLNVHVAYTAGWATTPPEIEQAVIELVALRYRERDHIGLDSRGIGPETVSFSKDDLTPAAKAICNQYQRVVPA